MAQAHLGAALPRRQLSVRRLAKTLERILQDTSMREAAARAGERIRQRNAWDGAVDSITSGESPRLLERAAAH